jgi:uncharacterized protein (UPF0548 family)
MPAMFLLRRPTPERIEAALAAGRRSGLSYAPIGISRPGASALPGYQLDVHRVSLGTGDACWEAAREAVRDWRMFALGWAEVLPRRAPVEEGTHVAVVASHLGFWSVHVARVVFRIEEEDRFGFAYGTTLEHAERGEEIFQVERDPATGEVSYALRAVSRPRSLLARLGYPYTRHAQARFRKDSGRAMQKACSKPRI